MSLKNKLIDKITFDLKDVECRKCEFVGMRNVEEPNTVECPNCKNRFLPVWNDTR